MRTIVPKAGEHPLAAKCRQLHRLLAIANGSLFFFDLLATMSWVQVSGIRLGYVVGAVLAVWFACNAYWHAQWAR